VLLSQSSLVLRSMSHRSKARFMYESRGVVSSIEVELAAQRFS